LTTTIAMQGIWYFKAEHKLRNKPYGMRNIQLTQLNSRFYEYHTQRKYSKPLS